MEANRIELSEGGCHVETDVFVSFASADADFVMELKEALERHGQSVSVADAALRRDDSIAAETESRIDQSRAVVYVISPDSVSSPSCRLEVEAAENLGKLLIPVQRVHVTTESWPTPARHRIALPFEKTEDFDSSINLLLEAVRWDASRIDQHRVLAVKSNEWLERSRDPSYLLRGNALIAAEEFIERSQGLRDPEVTEAQKAFVNASRLADRGAPPRAPVVDEPSPALTAASAGQSVDHLSPSASLERKTVTALFCDIVNSTPMAEALDPEDLNTRLGLYFAEVRTCIERYGGTIEKYIGDAIHATFGTATTHANDPERAVRAALDVISAIGELNARGVGLDTLQVRVGINTGEAVVASETQLVEGDNRATSSAVFIASRLQSLAPAGAILVGRKTFLATHHVFEFADLGSHNLKGLSKPTRAWRVLGVSPDLQVQQSAPLVGRDLELRQLTTIFHLVLRESATKLVTIVGESGVGKSRLVNELRDSLATSAPLTWLVGRAPPYGESTGFSALGEVVKAYSGIFETDTPEEAVTKLDAVLPTDEPDRTWLSGRLLSLLGLGSAVETTRADSFAAWVRFLQDIAGRGPTVIVFEDVHWADPGLLEFIHQAAEEAGDVPLLLIVTARTELLTFHPHWAAGLFNQTQIAVRRLSEEQTERLIQSVAQDTHVDDEQFRAIVERSEGNPLFATEYVRWLRDLETLPSDSTKHPRRANWPHDLPDGVRGVIAARIGLLDGITRGVLQDAAIIGRIFWAGAVESVNRASVAESEVNAALKALARHDLVKIRRSTMAGETEYIFTHALIRDVAYDQVLKRSRIDKHLAAAGWLESRIAERSDDVAEVLAFHTATAAKLAQEVGDTDRAREIRARMLRYYVQAADAASAVAAFPKALAHINAAYVAAADADLDPGEWLSLRLWRADLRRRTADLEGAEEDAEVVRATAAEHGRPELADRAQRVLTLVLEGAVDVSVPSTRVRAGTGGAPHPRATVVGPGAIPVGERSPWTTSWAIVITADADYYERDRVASGDEFPQSPPRLVVRLTRDRMTIGRTAELEGIRPDIDLLRIGDKGASRRHAEVLRAPDGGWSILDVGSSNGTRMNGSVELQPGELQRLAEGDYLNLGYWSRLTLQVVDI